MSTRWLYHVRVAGVWPDPYSPASLAEEGFIHCSFQPLLRESARRYFPAGAVLEVLRIDPRLVGVPIEVAETPRGAMPHVRGPLAAAAVAARLTVDEVETAPDEIADLPSAR